MKDENDTQTEELSLRDTLEDAYDEATADADTEEQVSAPAQALGEDDEREDDGRARDERGRFAKKDPNAIGDGEPVQPEHAQRQAGEGEQPAQQAQELKAPQSWKPAAREHWNALPPEVREEVYRRETGMQQYLSQTAEERKLAQAFHQVYAPYEAIIRGEGTDPLSAVDNLFQTAYQLRTAPPQTKAQLVAGMIQQFGVDVQLLDRFLTQGMQGGPMPQMQPQQGPMGDPRVDQLMQALANVQQETQSKRDQAAQSEIAQFAQTHEFLDDVREHMADLMEVSQRRGVELSLEDAYNQACRLNPEIAKVLDQRAKVAAAATTQSRTARARAAASSVGGAPTKAPRKDPSEMSIREAALRAFEQHAGG